MSRIAISHGVLISVLTLTIVTHVIADDETELTYNRDIRPILSDKCFRCHGPDAAARQAEMRLDDRADATAKRGDYRVITPHRPDISELIRRVTSADDDIRMPPPDSGSVLSTDEIETLRRWIKSGAAYQPHWSFIRPLRPSKPNVQTSQRPKNAIDAFVFERLERENLTPSKQADSATLIRRVTLDLTGLPPTPAEVDAFERDFIREPDAAYLRLVDRLLASPRFGEHMALSWLDAARYADTNGYFTDDDRTMWPWRDWVINAFNNNMPFDRFTIEQLAGDLLPNATIDQKIATGFNRNHMVNNETGIIEEEYRVEYVVDRVDTTSTVWMGLTLGCARCHDHKYDPISQTDFYRFFSYFNNVPERGLSGSGGNSAPVMRVPVADLQTRIDQLSREITDAERQFAGIEKQLADAQSQWEATAIERLPSPTNQGLAAHLSLETDPTADSKTGSVEVVPGMLGNAAKFSGNACIRVATDIDFDRTDAFSFGAWIQPKGAGCVMSKTDDANDMRGFDVTLRKGKAIVNIVNRWNRNAIQVTTATSIASGRWQHLLVTYDGSSKAAGVRIYADGRLQSVHIAMDTLNASIRNDQPLRIGRRQASASYSGLIDEVRIYDRELTEKEVHDLASSELVRGIVSRPTAKRTAEQRRKLKAWFIENRADEKLAGAVDGLAKLKGRHARLQKSMPTTMVMQESKTPREAFVLTRGQYDQPGRPVTAGVPEFFKPILIEAANGKSSLTTHNDRSANRLDLAMWLVDPKHPLTARVTVNRLWQQLFGTGIVKTVDDFGTQGDWPSHPELLDWLAVELIESGWNIKHLLRLIVSSTTYRQSAHCDLEHRQRDRENRLLARGPRFRMSAEMLRDNALAISGLLVEKLGGPSVHPYQPDGLWEDVTYDSDRAYLQADGDSLYRRSLYTFWKRQSPPPNMLVFDAPTRETCTVERSRTNTPLQALVLMNDPTYVEAARRLAERTMIETKEAATDRIVFAFRSATARHPTEMEVNTLLRVFQSQHAVFEKHPHAAERLISVGESQFHELLDTTELAAWTTVTSVILSLDETITKP